MAIEKLIFLFSVGLIASCTGAVAPTNEGGGSATTATKNTTSGTTDSAATDSSSTGTGTTADDDGDDDSGTTTTGVTALGTITAETTDIASFVGKSTYIYNIAASGMNMLTIADSVIGDTYFKKIIDYGDCEKKPAATTTTATKSITLTFMKSFTADAAHKVDANGFPKENSNTIADPEVSTAGVKGTYTDSTKPTAGITVKTGTINFSTRPAAAKDTYEVTVDLVLSDGKKYKATLEGVADAPPTSTATAPTCADDEQAIPVYE